MPIAVWSDDLVVKARSLWMRHDYSCEMVGKVFGKGKNAIIGLARRKGFPKKPKMRFQAVIIAFPEKPKPPRPKIIFTESTYKIAKPKKGMRLADTKNGLEECRWMIGDPKNGICCGLPSNGLPYCETHYRRSVK